MLSNLQPISGRHSINKVQAAVFIPQAFLKPEVLFNEYADKDAFRKYQKKTLLKAKNIHLKDNMIGVSDDEIRGFIFEEFDDVGKLKNVLKLENVAENKSMIILENRIYERWDTFKKVLLDDLDTLNKGIQIYISAISLSYQDEFIWKSNDEIPINDILNTNSDFLNKKFLSSRNSTSILISQSKKDELQTEEKTEISFNNDVKRISLGHQFGIILSQIESLSELSLNGTLRTHFDTAHTENKRILKDILSLECQELIHLN